MEIVLEPARREQLVRRALTLEGLTITWNLVEAGAAVTAGLMAKSVALMGFGLDSLIELVAAGMLFMRLRAEGRGREPSEVLERRALRVVAATFFALAAYVGLEAAWTLWKRQAPESSSLGLAVTALALLVMPLLARAKLQAGRRLGSAALVADAKESFACAWLAGAALAGLALNATVGAWWADPAAALAMVPLLVREGREALEGASAEGPEESDDD
jgi:divalent metal cation (Fe/Co/Zn/Cd) transporter